MRTLTPAFRQLGIRHMNHGPQRHSKVPCFAVQVDLRRGLTPAQEMAFSDRTAEWMQSHEWLATGTQTRWMVHAEHELSVSDQVTALLALLDDVAVRRVVLGELMQAGGSERLAQELQLAVDVHDPVLPHARALYEAGRLDAQALLQVLGGYRGP